MRADVEELWCEKRVEGGQIQLHIHRDGHGVSARLHVDGELRWTERFASDEQAERRGWALRRLLRSGELEYVLPAPQLVSVAAE